MLIDIRSNDRDLIYFVDPEKARILKDKTRDLTVGLTSGCFDLFHHLHLTYLQKCRRLCDVLIVGVDADDLVRKTKGDGRPIIPEHQRVQLVDALKCVDITFVMGSLSDWERAIYAFFPDVLFKNTHFKAEDIINPLNAEVVIVPDVMQFESTSQIIEEIKRAKK